MKKYFWIIGLIPIWMACNGSSQVNDEERLPEEDNVAQDGVDMEMEPPADPDDEELMHKDEPAPPKTEAPVDTVQQQETLEEQIIGRWEWHHTVCCGRTPRTIRDTSTVPTYLEFTNGGKMLIMSGDATVAEHQFEVGVGKVYPDRPYIEIKEYGLGPALLSIENGNRLVLNFGYMDAQTEFYDKVE